MKRPLTGGPVPPRRPSLAETVSAHDAAAKFRATKLADDAPLPPTQPHPPADTMPPAVHQYLKATVATESSALMPAIVEEADAAGRLPSAWYRDPHEVAIAERMERHALAIKGGAIACIVTGAALGFWLVLRTGPALQPEPPSHALALMAETDVRAAPVLLRPQPAVVPEGVTPVQVLAVAERFVAAGDILAARAVLGSTATAGDPRAQFALAETYDPNMLRSWNARTIEGNAGYARLLYQAARTGGVADAQARIDALP